MPRPTFRPGLLALAIALAVPAPCLHAAPAEQASVRDYRIAAGPLAGTLNRIAAQAGLVLTLDPALAEGRSAHAVQGRFDAPGALREALKLSLIHISPANQRDDSSGFPTDANCRDSRTLRSFANNSRFSIQSRFGMGSGRVGG